MNTKLIYILLGLQAMSIILLGLSNIHTAIQAADKIKACKTYLPESGRVLLAGMLADYFARENPKFQRERFLQACGIETDKK